MRARLTIDKIRTIIESKKSGGDLLSNSFKNGDSRIKGKCKKHNYIWEPTVSDISLGRWCAKCGGSFPLTIKDAHHLAESRGGKCLSTVYINANKWLKWQCSENHQWEAKYGNVYTGNWCRICSESLGERICRQFFEQLFKEPFTKAYPDWLINKQGYKLELDGYCQKIGIAFEHQGRQHYQRTPLFTKDEKIFEKRLEHDSVKRKLCKNMGITLIEVPEIGKVLPVEKVKSFIKEKCLQNKIGIPNDFDEIIVDYNKVYRTPQWREKLKEIKQLAILKGGECLSDVYEASDKKLLFRCKNNHSPWWATPNKIKMGRWCNLCADVVRANKRRGTIERMQEIARVRKGKCLSKKYINSQADLLWECKRGHRWEAVLGSIVQGSWCRKCRGYEKRTIE